MQNFTLGKNGKGFSIFAFILLMGMFPSFGQTGDCPLVDDDDTSTEGNQQSFCYLSTVANLNATAASGETLRWYRTSNSTTPIPSNELLREEVYYAGNADGDCEDRPSVIVTIDDIGAPEPSFGVVFSPCMYSTTGVNTVQELIELVNPTTGGTDIEVYTEEFSGAPLDENENLSPGESYFVGQRNAATDCPSSRVAVRYDPIEVQPPSGEPVQTFCEGATVADLQASGINRWYSTENSNPPLDEDTPLIAGELYYATQIINRVNSPEPPCESMARFEVEVIIESAGEDNTDNVLCISEADNQLNTVANARAYYEGLLEEDVPTGGSFSPSLQSIVDSYDSSAGYFETTYTATFPSGCEDDVILAVTVQEDPNAGQDTEVAICESDIAPFLPLNAALIPIAETYIEDFINDTGLDPTGEFSPSIEDLFAQINEDAENGTFPQTYLVTYTVDNLGCVASSELELTIEGTPDAGETVEEPVSLCESDVEDQGIFDSEDTLGTYYLELLGAGDTGGTFNPELSTLITDYNDGDPTGPYPVEYTVEGTTNCDPATTSATIIIEAPILADAGEIEDFDVCVSDEPVNLFTQLDLDPEDRGEFTTETGDVLEDGNFTPSTIDSYTITYTVSEDNEGTACIFDSNFTEFEITVVEGTTAIVEDINDYPTCTSGEVITLSTLLTANTTPNGTFTVDGTTSTTFDPSTMGVGTYDVTYTVDGEELECVTGDASDSFVITVTDEEIEAVVEDIADFTTCLEASTITLSTLLVGDTTTGGTFTVDGTTATTFDPSTMGVGTYDVTYTVDGEELECVTGDASDSFVITVTDEEIEAVVEDIADFTTCLEASTITLSTLLVGDTTTGGIFTVDGTTATTFDPSTMGVGTYDVTYTVDGEELECVTGDASDSFVITVTDEEIEAVVEDIADFTTCLEASTITLSTLLVGDTTTGGTFTVDGTTATTFDPSTMGVGTYDVTYTVDGEELECVTGDASDSFVITVTDEEIEAVVEDIADFTTCLEASTITLSTLLVGDTTTGGIFTVDGTTATTFDPSTMGVGTYEVTYTVDGEELECVTGDASDSFEIEVTEGSTIVATIERTYCISEVLELIENPEDAVSLFTDLLEEQGNVDLTGEFTPDVQVVAAQIAAYLSNPATPFQEFETTYTVSNGGCESSTNIEVTIINEIEAELTPVDNPAPICQNAGVQDLTDFIGDNPEFGIFEGYEDGTFNPGTMGPGEYEITYSLDEEDISCVTGSASITFTVTVLEIAYAGIDNIYTVCQNAGSQNLFSRLDDDIVDMNGEWTYNGVVIEEGIMEPSQFDPDIYEFIYTVPAKNECGNDTSSLFVTVRAVPTAGPDPEEELTVCQNEGIQDLFSLLGEEANMSGRFTLNGNIIANGQMNPALYEPDTYLVTYTVSTGDGNCSDSAIITVVVLESANAGADMEVPVCVNEGPVNLFGELSADADMDGTFTLGDDTITEGLFDPAVYGEGSYEVMYSVESDNELCGTSTSTMTVEVNAAPEAPTVTDLTFCAIEGATVANLGVAGDNITYYSNVELTDELELTDLLVEQPYYVTDMSSEGGCVSEAAIIMVAINDAPTPTIDETQLELCVFDNNTLEDLNIAINEPGDIRWYASEDGSDALSVNTPLEDGVTYYAALYDGTIECESSQRLEYTVQLEDCDLVFPEGISPNDDGRNDRFTVRNIAEKYPNYSLEIFNRWGNTVYEGNANTPDWNGTSTESGNLGDDVLPVGVYFYIVNFNDGATPPKQGKIYLSR